MWITPITFTAGGSLDSALGRRPEPAMPASAGAPPARSRHDEVTLSPMGRVLGEISGSAEPELQLSPETLRRLVSGESGRAEEPSA